VYLNSALSFRTRSALDALRQSTSKGMGRKVSAAADGPARMTHCVVYTTLDAQCVKLATVVGRTELTVLSLKLDVRPTTLTGCSH